MILNSVCFYFIKPSELDEYIVDLVYMKGITMLLEKKISFSDAPVVSID